MDHGGGLRERRRLREDRRAREEARALRGIEHQLAGGVGLGRAVDRRDGRVGVGVRRRQQVVERSVVVPDDLAEERRGLVVHRLVDARRRRLDRRARGTRTRSSLSLAFAPGIAARRSAWAWRTVGSDSCADGLERRVRRHVGDRVREQRRDLVVRQIDRARLAAAELGAEGEVGREHHHLQRRRHGRRDWIGGGYLAGEEAGVARRLGARERAPEELLAVVRHEHLAARRRDGRQAEAGERRDDRGRGLRRDRVALVEVGRASGSVILSPVESSL